MLTIIGWLAHALSRQRERKKERKKKTRTCNLRYVVCHDFYEKDGGYTTEQFLLPIMHFIGVGYTKKMRRDLFDEERKNFEKATSGPTLLPQRFILVLSEICYTKGIIRLRSSKKKKKTWKVEGEWSKMSKIYFRVRLHDIVRTSIWRPRPSFETGGGSFYGDGNDGNQEGEDT